MNGMADDAKREWERERCTLSSLVSSAGMPLLLCKEIKRSRSNATNPSSPLRSYNILDIKH